MSIFVSSMALSISSSIFDCESWVLYVSFTSQLMETDGYLLYLYIMGMRLFKFTSETCFNRILFPVNEDLTFRFSRLLNESISESRYMSYSLLPLESFDAVVPLRAMFTCLCISYLVSPMSEAISSSILR